jgi:hypothetical protein
MDQSRIKRADILFQWKHPSVIRIFGFIEECEAGDPGIVMSFFRNGTLAEPVREAQFLTLLSWLRRNVSLE